MIRNPDLDSFVCCALCLRIIPQPLSSATFNRIREYKPFRTWYYTHHDILAAEPSKEVRREARAPALWLFAVHDLFVLIVKRLEQTFNENYMRRRRQTHNSALKKMKAELWSQAEMHKEDAVDKALKEADANHNAFVQDIILKLEKESKEEVRKVKAEMQQYMEDQLKREVEAAEQHMAQRLQRALTECAREKMRAVAEARKQEEAALEEAARQHRKHLEQLKEESVLAEELHRKNIDRLNKEKCHELLVALSITQKESQIETEKQHEEAETLHLDEMGKVMATLKAVEEQVKTLTQKLEKMTDWKDSLETEI